MTYARPTLELVLPGGEFATLRAPTLLDWLWSMMVPAPLHLLTLCARCALIDGKAFTADEWGAMEFERAGPVLKHVIDIVNRANKVGGGVA